MEKRELKLETVRKQAEIRLAGGRILSGDFFVSAVSPSGPGPERILDLLNGEKRFLPFMLEGEEVVLIRRRAILTVVPEKDDTLPAESLYRKISASIQLDTGDTIHGHVFTDMPESHSRLSDFFNHCGEFFFFRAGRRPHLVNSRRILSIRQRERAEEKGAFQED